MDHCLVNESLTIQDMNHSDPRPPASTLSTGSGAVCKNTYLCQQNAEAAFSVSVEGINPQGGERHTQELVTG